MFLGTIAAPFANAFRPNTPTNAQNQNNHSTSTHFPARQSRKQIPRLLQIISGVF